MILCPWCERKAGKNPTRLCKCGFPLVPLEELPASLVAQIRATRPGQYERLTGEEVRM